MTTFIKSKTVKAVVGLLAMVAVAFALQAHASYTFTQSEWLGQQNAEVQQVQMFLNTNGFTVSTTGPGSPGNESTYFGAKTKAAVSAFQVAKGITPTAGYWGPKSIAAANAIEAGMTGTLPAGCTSTTGFSSTTGMSCSGGSMTTLPAGCTSTVGFSPTTGASCSGGTAPSQGTGAVTVALSADNPASSYLVAGQATANLLNITLSGSGTISSLQFQRTGLSNNTALDNVYLYQGATRITGASSVNTNGVVLFNNVNLAVNGSTELNVKADIDSAANGQTVGLTLTGYELSGGTAMTSANLAGNIFSISSGTGILANVVIDQGGSSPYNNVAAASLNAGVTQYPIWSAPVQVNTHNVLLKAATFEVIGSAPANSFANLGLFVNGTQVATSTGENANGYIVFDLSANPVTLTTGSSTLEVRADIVAGAYRSFQIALENAADLEVTDSQLGVNVAPTTGGSGSGYTFVISQGGLIQINAGSATFSIDPTFNTLTNITGGSTNAVIGKFQLSGYGEPVKVNTITVVPFVSNACIGGTTYGGSGCSSSGTNEFQYGNGLNNVTLYFNGQQVGSSQNWTNNNVSGADPLTFNVNGNMVIPAGQISTFEVHADLYSSQSASATSDQAYTAGTVGVTVNVGSGNAQGQVSQNPVNIPAATIATTGLTMQTGALAVSNNGNFFAQTIGPNTTLAHIGSFTLTNNSTTDSANVTSLQVGLSMATAASTNYSNLEVSTSGSSASPIGSPVNPVSGAASGTSATPTSVNTFSVNFTIAPSQSQTVDVYANIGTASAAAVQTTLQVTARGVTSNVNICTPTSTYTGNGCSTGYLAGPIISIGSATFGTPTISTATTTAQYVASIAGMPATNASKTEFNFSATSGSATITQLYFKNTGTASAISGMSINGTAGSMSGDIGSFQSLNIAVPNGQGGIPVDVLSSYAPVGASGITTTTTGDVNSTLELCYVQYQTGGATHTVGSTTCGSSGGYPIASTQQMVIVGSAPQTVAVSTPVGAVLTTGNVEALDVTITASGTGPVTINSLPLAASLTAGSGAAFATGSGNPFIVKDAGNNAITLTGTDYFTSATGSTSASPATVTFATPYRLNANQQQTFKIFVNVASLGTLSGNAPNAFLYSSLPSSSAFNWTDLAGNATNPSTGNITSLIYNYPSTTTVTVHN